MKGVLLLDLRPLVVVPELAVAIGLAEAIILQQIHYWLEINRREERSFRDGYTWTYNSVAEWQKQFPFYTTKTIQRTITKLENQGILISKLYNKENFDRTKWYRIDYAALEIAIGQNVPIDEQS